MKKMIIGVIGVVLLAFTSSFAGTLCFKDNFGLFYVLSGGKVNVKPFSGKLISVSCQQSGNAVILSSGTDYQVTWNVAHQSPNCPSIIETLTLDKTLSFGSGNIDLKQDGAVDGNVTWTQIDCSNVPEQ